MISILSEPTAVDLARVAINAPLLLIENRTVANVLDLNACMDAFWGLPDDVLNAIMNSVGAENMFEMFAAHERYSESFNTLLADRGIECPRATIGRRREIVFVDGVLSVVPAPVAPIDPPAPPTE